jgi:hypothetical protein
MIADRAKELERGSREGGLQLDKSELLSMLDCDEWTVRMHLCRMLSRVEWSPSEYAEVLEFAQRQADDKNTFIRAWALDALAWFAVTDQTIRPAVYQRLEAALGSGAASVKVRAREGLRRLASSDQGGRL